MGTRIDEAERDGRCQPLRAPDVRCGRSFGWRRSRPWPRHAAPRRVAQQPPGGDNLGLELVDPKVLRVCADPANMPFSNEHGEGFENKIAELLAAKLDKRLAYTWYPQSTGFVRKTLGSFRCDVIMGFPQGDDLVQSTNPYYRSVYALVTKQGGELDGVDTLGDARLKGKRIGIVAGTPPATYLVAQRPDGDGEALFAGGRHALRSRPGRR